MAGYYVEYSGILFVLFFIAEYANMILMSMLSIILFFGGWYAPFGIPFSNEQLALFFSAKILFIIFLFVWVRASVPRLRYDQLMSFGWKVVLPISLGWFFFTACVLFFLDGFPPFDF